MKESLTKFSNSVKNTPTLEEVSEAFEIWRQNKSHTDCIPDELWSAAIELTGSHTPTTVCKRLRLGYNDLKKRMSEIGIPERRSNISGVDSPVSFIELPQTGLNETDCVIEMGNGRGLHLKMTCRGQPQLVALSFWQMLLESQS